MTVSVKDETFLETLQVNISKRLMTRRCSLTFEVQVAGSIGVLCNGAWVDLEGMYIAGVPGHHHVVPLVVIEGLVWVALHQRRPIAQIKDVVDKSVWKHIGVWEGVCVTAHLMQKLLLKRTEWTSFVKNGDNQRNS